MSFLDPNRYMRLEVKWHGWLRASKGVAKKVALIFRASTSAGVRDTVIQYRRKLQFYDCTA